VCHRRFMMRGILLQDVAALSEYIICETLGSTNVGRKDR